MSGSLLRSVTMVALGLGCGCSTTAPVTPTVATSPLPVRESVVDTHLDGVPGGKVARLQRVMATVAELKPEQGRMVLLDELGNRHELQAPGGMAQLAVGDRVEAQIATETIVSLLEPGAPQPESACGATLLIASEQGGKPGIVALEKRKLTARVVAVDLVDHTATLRFEDGKQRTVAVRPDVKLDQSRVGKEVVIITSTTMALTVNKLKNS